jgi:hypothetical protein
MDPRTEQEIEDYDLSKADPYDEAWGNDRD